MAEPNIYGLTPSQLKRLAEMLAAFESGNLWPSEKATRLPRAELSRIRVHNDAGATIPAWGVMRISGVETAGDAWRIKVAKPNTTLQRFYLVNGPDDIAASTDGWGTHLWHAGHILYDTGNTPAIGETWGPQDATWTIKKNNWGFNIVAGNTGSGAVSRTIAVQHIVNHVLGKTNTTHNKSASGTVNLYTGTLGSETQVTSMTVSAYNRFCNVGSGKWVHCSWLPGGWDLSAAEA